MMKRSLPTTLPALVAAVALTACGGSGDETVPAIGDSEQLGAEFAQCMSEHGVDIPDFAAGDAAGSGSAESQQAFQACGELAAEAVPPEDQQSLEDSAQAFADCMREQGADFPELDPETGSIGGPGIDPSDPDFLAAQEECAPLMDTASGLPEG